MARIRSVKPDLRTSKLVASWPFEVRYFFVLLWGYLDDKGRGRDIPKQIAGDCFPHDDNVTASKVDKWLDQMTAGRNGRPGPICRYEVDGIRYVHSLNWPEHQKPNRPTPSRLPPCPLHEGLSESDSDSSGQVTPDSPDSNSLPTGTEVTKRSRYQKEMTVTGSNTIGIESHSDRSSQVVDPEFSESLNETSVPGIRQQGRRGEGEVEQHAREQPPRGASGPTAADAHRLVRRILGSGYPAAVLTALAISTAELLRQYDQATLEAALTEWRGRTGIGPGVLPSLVADAVKRRNGHDRPRNGHKPNADDTIRELLDIPTGLPALPGGQT